MVSLNQRVDKMAKILHGSEVMSTHENIRLEKKKKVENGN